MKKQTLIFVCSGNTCRSPMAATYLKNIIDKNAPWKILSAGISAINGAPASANAKKIASKYGFELDSHRSKMLTADMIKNASLIITMTKSHKDWVLRISQSTIDEDKVRLLSDFLENEKGSDIPDPFGSDETEYENCFLKIKAAVEALAKYLSKI